MRTMTAVLALAALLLPAPTRAYTASEANKPADKEKELPKAEVEKRQEALNNDKRFDAYKNAVGDKANGLKKKIDSCKTEACFDSAGSDLDAAKRGDFMKSEPRAPAAAGLNDASRDAFYRDGADKMGKLSQASPPASLGDAKGLGADGLRDALNGRPPAGLGHPLSQEALKNSQPVADLKSGPGVPRGGPMEQAAPAAAKSSELGPDSPKPAVAKAQGELNAYLRGQGKAELKQDGVYGPKTAQAVKDVQRQLGLKETGKIDPETREAVAKNLPKMRPQSVATAAAKAAGDRAQVVRKGGMTIDTDGDLSHGDPKLSALARQDPYRLKGTSLRYSDNKALDPTKVPYVVIPGGSKFAKVGDIVKVEYQGRSALAVVGDVGPPHKFGEGSMILAQSLGISPNGVSGGVGSGVTYTFTGRNVGRMSGQDQLMAIRAPSE